MELEEIKKPLPEFDLVSESNISRSLLTIQSKSVSEIAAEDIENAPEENLDDAPGNPIEVHTGSESRFIKKTTIIDDDFETASVTSLKNFHKQPNKYRKNRNKVSPLVSGVDNLERPTSAPSNQNRQWLKEINENRPMTAAPRVSVNTTAVIVTKQEKTEPEEKASAVKDLEQPNEPDVNKEDVEEIAKDEPFMPTVNETAYIPYEYARAMISRIANDMNKMKANHLNIMKKMDVEYQKMEQHTQDQFKDCISQLQERHKRRVQHYRQVIQLLHTELQAKGELRSEAIANLKERNKELALEREKIQQQLSKSRLHFVPSQIKSIEKEEAEKENDEKNEVISHESEKKVAEDARETEKRLSRESSRVDADSLTAVAATAVSVAAVVDVVKVEEKEKSDDETKSLETRLEEEEKRISVDEQEKIEDKKNDVESESEDEIVDEVAVAVVVKEESHDVSSNKKEEEIEKKKENVSPEKNKPKSPAKSSIRKSAEPLSSADQAQQSKQQALIANKQAKRIKELERQLEIERRKADQTQKSAMDVDAELENVKNELSCLKKALSEQKLEKERLEQTAIEGAFALQELPELKETIKSLNAENQSLVTNYNSERVLRKKYYNMVEDMKGKIRVYCRVRPLSKTEKANKNKCAVLVPDEYTVKIEMNRGGTKEFQFDEIFTETASQANIFEDTNSLIQSAVDGYNVCIFAYGQTGSGKTYTMIGDNDQTQPGIAPRAFNRIFDIVEKSKKKFTFKISCYMLELYNEKLVDLLSTSKDDSARLDIKKDNKGMVMVQGTEVLDADNPDDLFSIFLKGSTNRHTASTKMNEDSSRSHLIIGIIIESTNLTSGAITRGKLSLVDLAGSERVAKTGATAQQLKEANSINKSLSALGDVISALSSEQSFIPYRNNKLTMLMQDSLGGNAKTLMFVNISPADYNSDESAISLTYASRVKLIKNDATKMADSKEVARLKQIIAKLKAGEQVDD